MNVSEQFNQLRVQMPERYNDIDKNWIAETLQQLSFNERKKVIICYTQVYLEAFESEPLYYKKENAAGRAANTRLREYAVKCLAKHNERVSRPPVLSAV